MSNTAFLSGVTYTPRTQTHTGWAQADIGLMREQFNQLAELGISHVVLQPSWFRLQPHATRIAAPTMRLLEQCLDLAHAHKLTAIVSLLAIDVGGALALPEWHNHADVVGWLQGRTTRPISTSGTAAIIDGRWHTLRAADLFRTPDWVNAQQLLVQTVMGYFASHPAATDWILGAGWSRVPGTTTRVDAHHWWRQLCETARDVAPRARLMSVIDAPALTAQHALGIDTLTTQCDTLIVTAAMPELTMRQQRRLSTPAAFSHELVHALSHKPVIVALSPVLASTTQSQWRTVPWHQQSLDVPCVAGDDAGLYVEHILTRLHTAGAHGILFPHVLPQSQHHDDTPISWLSQQLSFVDAHGQLSSAGIACRHWHQPAHLVHTATSSIDPERYWYRPVHEFRRLWHEYP